MLYFAQISKPLLKILKVNTVRRAKSLEAKYEKLYLKIVTTFDRLTFRCSKRSYLVTNKRQSAIVEML